MPEVAMRGVFRARQPGADFSGEAICAGFTPSANLKIAERWEDAQIARMDKASMVGAKNAARWKGKGERGEFRV